MRILLLKKNTLEEVKIKMLSLSHKSLRLKNQTLMTEKGIKLVAQNNRSMREL